MAYTNQSQNSASYANRVKRESGVNKDYERTFDEKVIVNGEEKTYGELTFEDYQNLAPASYSNQSRNSASYTNKS